jgi:hypothetical protein
MSLLLRTPAKKVIRENIQNIKEAASIGDAVACFHSAGLTAVGAPNGTDPNSYTVTVTNMDNDFQRVQAEIDRNLKDKGLRLVSMSYAEDPVTHAKVHKCVVKHAVTI